MQTGYYRRIEQNECDFVLGHRIRETSFCAQDLDYDSSICYGDLGSMIILMDWSILNGSLFTILALPSSCEK